MMTTKPATKVEPKPSLSRRNFIITGAKLMTWAAFISWFGSIGRSRAAGGNAPSVAEVLDNLKRTKDVVRKFPVRDNFLKKYFEELEKRLAGSNSEIWLAYQNDRLNRIRWLLDVTDDGVKSGFRLKVRPYDIPWVVYGLPKLEKKNLRDKDLYNGWRENMEKMLACPNMSIECTDRFADFCYLCQDLLPDGCIRHPDFGDYGKIFPQPNQMNKELKDNCEWILSHLGLNWKSVVTTRELFARCVKNIPDPAAFTDFPEIDQKNWDTYRAGIQAMQAWLARQG